MGQKVNPHGMRVGVIDGWNSNWYADKKSFSDEKETVFRRDFKNRD